MDVRNRCIPPKIRVKKTCMCSMFMQPELCHKHRGKTTDCANCAINIQRILLIMFI